MRRIATAVLVLIASLVAHPGVAYAAHGWWGWLEEFSGPGTFRVRSPFQNIHFQFLCTSDDVLRVDPEAWNIVIRAMLDAAAAPPLQPPPVGEQGDRLSFASPLLAQQPAPLPEQAVKALKELRALRSRERELLRLRFVEPPPLLLPPLGVDFALPPPVGGIQPQGADPVAPLARQVDALVRVPFQTLLQEPQVRTFGTPFPATRDVGRLARAIQVALGLLEDQEQQRERRLKGCWFVDITRYIAHEDRVRGFPTIRARTVDVGRTYFVAGPFDIAAAIGYVQFKPDDSPLVRRLTLTPLRFHVRPFWFVDPSRAPDALRWAARLAYVPKIYVKQTAVLGTIRGSEFGAPPPAPGEEEFRTTGELVTSYGVVFDLGELIGAFVHR